MNRRLLISSLLLVLTGLLPLGLRAQGRYTPLSKDQVMELLRSASLRARVADFTASFGIDFDLTQDAETELREAGATGAQLEAMWRAAETRAVMSLRILNTAEVRYVSSYKKGYSANLAVLGPAEGDAKPSVESANLIDSRLAAGKPGNSYVLVYTPAEPEKDGKFKKYTIAMRPTEWREGRKSFFTDQSGVIRETSEDREPTAQDPPIGG